MKLKIISGKYSRNPRNSRNKEAGREVISFERRLPVVHRQSGHNLFSL